MPASDKSNIRKLTYSGIILAILMVCIYLYTIIPTNKFAILMFLSFFIGFELIETDVKFTVIFFLASIVLTLIFPVNKLALLLYYTFFGSYGLIKYFIEKISSKMIEYILKVVYFVTMCFVNYSFSKLFLPEFITKYPIYIVLLISIIAFFVYDYLYTLVMLVYIKRTGKIRR